MDIKARCYWAVIYAEEGLSFVISHKHMVEGLNTPSFRPFIKRVFKSVKN